MHDEAGGLGDRGDLIERVDAIDPTFAAGVEHLGRVIHQDGRLSARTKSLIAAATTAVRDPAALPIAVATAFEFGNVAEDLRAVALTLYLSRGVPPCRDLLDAVDAIDGIDAHGADAAADASTSGQAARASVAPVTVAEVVAEFASVFGTVPDRVNLLVEHCPDGLAAYHYMRVAGLSDGSPEPLDAELILMAVNAAEHRGDFAAVHAAGARRQGATEPQLVEAGLVAVQSGGVAAWLAAAEAIVSTRPTPTAAYTTEPPPSSATSATTTG